jgi:hypothetical protein
MNGRYPTAGLTAVGAKRTFKRKRYLVADQECVEDYPVSGKPGKC